MRQPELDDLLARLGSDWRVVDEQDLEKEFRFKDFREALDFTNRARTSLSGKGRVAPARLALPRVLSQGDGG